MNEAHVFDYHHHSEFSVDCTASMADICRVAVERGVSEIAFTEHMDFIPEEKNTGYFRYDAYMESIRRCREQFRDELAIVAGIEVDYCPDFENETAKWVEEREFDFVIGSVHYLRGKGNISEPRALDFFRGKTEREAYGEYWDVVLRCARFGIWETLGHIDVVKRYGTQVFGPFDETRHAEALGEILSTLVTKRIALEINTSGLRQPSAECYPSAALLRRYRELGGERITVGSDSHSVEHTGAGVLFGLRMARETGFAHVERFCRRKRSAVPISLEFEPGNERLLQQ
ncbi:MAG TPA: histidinol-phosphatase [Candidatus Latescibacteria bacterium]|nr:histidinol-phosphatase [Candidatus Latescibacterota bacterium]